MRLFSVLVLMLSVCSTGIKLQFNLQYKLHSTPEEQTLSIRTKTEKSLIKNLYTLQLNTVCFNILLSPSPQKASMLQRLPNHPPYVARG
jgi:hypothetical protein